MVTLLLVPFVSHFCTSVGVGIIIWLLMMFLSWLAFTHPFKLDVMAFRRRRGRGFRKRGGRRSKIRRRYTVNRGGVRL